MKGGKQWRIHRQQSILAGRDVTHCSQSLLLFPLQDSECLEELEVEFLLADR